MRMPSQIVFINIQSILIIHGILYSFMVQIYYNWKSKFIKH